jgi:biopolymer transport protein ExbD
MRESRAVVDSVMQAEPNVTPFLDVLLVLLIIFMYLSLSQQKIITMWSRALSSWGN